MSNLEDLERDLEEALKRIKWEKANQEGIIETQTEILVSNVDGIKTNSKPYGIERSASALGQIHKAKRNVEMLAQLEKDLENAGIEMIDKWRAGIACRMADTISRGCNSDAMREGLDQCEREALRDMHYFLSRISA
jgi:hypothetical protein